MNSTMYGPYVAMTASPFPQSLDPEVTWGALPNRNLRTDILKDNGKV